MFLLHTMAMLSQTRAHCCTTRPQRSSLSSQILVRSEVPITRSLNANQTTKTNLGRQQGNTAVVVTGQNFAPTDKWNLLLCM